MNPYYYCKMEDALAVVRFLNDNKIDGGVENGPYDPWRFFTGPFQEDPISAGEVGMWQVDTANTTGINCALVARWRKANGDVQTVTNLRDMFEPKVAVATTRSKK